MYGDFANGIMDAVEVRVQAMVWSPPRELPASGGGSISAPRMLSREEVSHMPLLSERKVAGSLRQREAMH
jgi:hypothetical protein